MDDGSHLRAVEGWEAAPRQVKAPVVLPIELALIVGAIRAHEPALVEDLDEAIGAWLAQRREPPGLSARRERLELLRAALNVDPYEPDPRD